VCHSAELVDVEIQKLYAHMPLQIFKASGFINAKNKRKKIEKMAFDILCIIKIY